MQLLPRGSLSLSIWTWRRYGVSPSRQIEVAFFFGGSCFGQNNDRLYSSFQMPVRLLAQQNGKFTQPATPSNKGIFFEKHFGAPQPSGLSSRTRFRKAALLATQEAPLPAVGRYDRWTAVYDISAHTVYLPMERDWKLTRPARQVRRSRHVHERMRGQRRRYYELTPREQLFHGVQALRLKPVGGGNVFGRRVSSHILTCSAERRFQ